MNTSKEYINERIEVMKGGREFESRKLGNINLVVLVDKTPTKVKEIIETGDEFIVIDSKNNIHKTRNVVSQMPYLEKIAKEMGEVFSSKLYEISVSPGLGICIYPYDEIYTNDSTKKIFFEDIEKTRKIAKKYNMRDANEGRRTEFPSYEFDV